MIKDLFVVLFLIFVSAAVPQLTSTNFESYLSSHELVFVKFFSPHCGHCVSMASEYEKLSEQSQGKKYTVVEVDCNTEDELCTSQNVQGYPSLRFYGYGATVDYEGNRKVEDMLAWLNQLEGTTLTLLEPEEAKSKIGSESFILVSGQTQNDLQAIALAQISSIFKVSYYALKSSTNFIRNYEKGSSQFQEYTRDENFPKSLIKWGFQKAREAVSQVTNQIFYYINEQRDFEYVAVLVDLQDDFSIQAKEPFRNWCNANRKAILCLSATTSNEVYEQIKQTVKANDKSVLSIIKSDFTIGYHFPHSTVTIQNLGQFFEDAKADKIDRTIDSEREIRDRFKFVNVVKLTNENYNTTVNEKDFVFVEYYSPMCGHCISFAADYEKLATYFKNMNANVIIAAVDVSEESEIKKQENIKGFPTFKFYIRGNSVTYEKQRTAEAMEEFITQITHARLLLSPTKEGIPMPFVAIGGTITDKSPLNYLPALFTTYPIYKITSENLFYVEVHTKQVKRSYRGFVELEKIADWLVDATMPTLVSLGEPVPSKKLERAMSLQTPILAVVNKHDREVAAPAIAFLNEYCSLQTTFICGTVHRDEQDYDELIEWLKDPSKQANRIIWINTRTLEKYLYNGDPNEATKESLDAFVSGIKNGSIQPYNGEEAVTQQARASRQEL